MSSAAEVVEVPCPVCNSTSFRTLFYAFDYANPTFKDKFAVCRCSSCGAGFLSPRPREEDMGRYYPATFYWRFEGGVELGADELLKVRRRQLTEKKRLVADLPPGRLLDIGAMKGEFIHEMNLSGWDTEGVEFSALPQNVFNVKISCGDFLAMPFPNEQFDCITLWAVLEHVYRPRAYIAKAAQLLKPGGRIVMLVTNFNSPQGRWFRMDDYPRHLTFFTPRSLQQLLQRHGLSVDRMFTSQRIFGSSLHGFFVAVAKLLGGYSVDELLYERSSTDGLAFCCKWRGTPSTALRWLSRVDRALSLPFERAFDRLCMGHILVCVAHKRGET